MTVRAGAMRDLVQVQEHSGNVEHGEPTFGRDEDWKPFVEKLWVEYREVSGGETIRGRQMELETTALLTTHYTPLTSKINKAMRIKYGERTLNIVAVMDMEGKKRELTIQTAEAK